MDSLCGVSLGALGPVVPRVVPGGVRVERDLDGLSGAIVSLSWAIGGGLFLSVASSQIRALRYRGDVSATTRASSGRRAAIVSMLL